MGEAETTPNAAEAPVDKTMVGLALVAISASLAAEAPVPQGAMECLPVPFTESSLERDSVGGIVDRDEAVEIYVLRLPNPGSGLDLIDVLPAAVERQRIGWDRLEPCPPYTVTKRLED